MSFNSRLLRIEVARQADKTLVRDVRPYVQLDYDVKKEQFLTAFDEDPVSQELEDGPEALSRIPSVASAGGNLYSLIGFNAGEEPAAQLREYLDANIKLGRTRAGVPHGDQVTFKTPVSFPTIAEVDDAMHSKVPLEWTERSYTSLLANGVPGLPHYLFDLVNKPKGSRSGTAVQIDKTLRAGSTGPIPYVSRLLGVLKALLSQNKR